MNTAAQGRGIKPVGTNLYSFLQLNLNYLSAGFFSELGSSRGVHVILSQHTAAQQLKRHKNLNILN